MGCFSTRIARTANNKLKIGGPQLWDVLSGVRRVIDLDTEFYVWNETRSRASALFPVVDSRSAIGGEILKIFEGVDLGEE